MINIIKSGQEKVSIKIPQDKNLYEKSGFQSYRNIIYPLNSEV